MIIAESWNWTHSADEGQVTAVTAWDSGEPLVIRVTFDNHGEAVPWEFARELLRAAFRNGEAGLGDVNIKTAGDTLHLTLTSPFGQATMRCAASRVAGFLTRTYAVTEAEAEDLAPGVDAALDEILGRRG